MIFLIEYDPPEGKLLRFDKFPNEERHRAEDERLEIELDLNRRGIHHEVVLLETESEDNLRKTHGRYFHSLTETVEQMIAAVKTG